MISDMRMRRLGSSGPEISVVGYGAWEAGGGSEWGSAKPDQQIVEAIGAGLDAGINWIDTAEVYGSGRSEELVGRAVGAVGRDEVLVFTKVGPAPEGTGFRPEEVHKACRGSLERLGVEHLDLYQLHWPDSTGVAVEDTWGAMAELVDQGLVRHIGVSNFDRELIERCEAIRHVDSLQPEFSMLQLDNRELIRWCGEHGVGTITYGPLAYGILTGSIDMDTRFDPGDHRAPGGEVYDSFLRPGVGERTMAVVDRLRHVADRLGVSVADVAIAWNVAQPGVTAAIVGSTSAEHVRANAAAGDLELDEATIAELERVVSEGPAAG
jgi:aryl-alcohol dehydrogenase-like predicted oxidoreductase